MQGPTAMPSLSDSRLSEFHFDNTNPGDVVEVITESGSVWTLVRTTLSRLDGGFMTHVVITTTSKAAGQIIRPWEVTTPEARLRIGSSIQFKGWYARSGRMMHTGIIRSIRLNGRKVL